MSEVTRIHQHRTVRVASVLLLGLSIAGMACAGDDSDSNEVSTSVEVSAPAGALDDIRAAVIRIDSVGTVVEPDSSLLDPVELIKWGGGSGFLIDSSGIAVTNQHVVAGAATIEAHVEGYDEPIPARLVGSSACADLAVIDLEGDGYPTLEWFEGDIEPGLDIFVAGFPLGDPEYTLLDGIVSKAQADGETSWASVESVIEHTAPTQPGNSGGPVVTLDGEVVAVNYAYGRPGTGTSQHFAIAREVAVPLIDDLRAGERGLGIRGQAVVDDEIGTSGVWVSAVETDSPADAAGVEPGDIIERLEGLPVGSDGTLETYCNVLGSHSLADPLSLQVLRFAEDVRLRGALNGAPLAPVESLGREVNEVVDVEPSATTYEDYVVITDDAEALEVEVPASWTDIDGDFPFVSDVGESGAGLTAAPDLTAYQDTWNVPGMTFSAKARRDALTVNEMLTYNVEQNTELDACTAQAVEDYDDGLYTGESQLFTDCGGTSTSVMLIAAEDESNDLLMLLTVQIVTDADLEALDRIIETFVVVGDVAPELAPQEYSGYEEIRDSSGTLAVEVPVEWTDIRSGVGFHDSSDPFDESLYHGVGVSVSTDADAWDESWGVPGLSLSTTTQWNGDIDGWFYTERTSEVEPAGWFYRRDCVEAEVTDYDDPLYSGIKGLYTECGGGDTEMTVIVAAPPDRAFVVLLAVTTVTDADDEALDRVLDTFRVIE